MWPYFMYDCYRTFLQSQTIAWPVTVTAVIVTTLHAPITYALIVIAKMGPMGAGMATSIAYWLLLIVSVSTTLTQRAYLRYTGKLSSNPVRFLQDTWISPWSREVFQDWGTLLRLGIPSAASLFLEWGGWEFNAALSGRLGNVELATHSILNQMSSLFWPALWGISLAAAILAGNALGAGDAITPRRISHLVYIFGMTAGVLEAASTLIYRRYLGKIFTDDEAVISMAYSMVPIFFLYFISDTLKTVGMTFLRSGGRPTVTAWVLAAACLFLGYPTSIGLGLFTSLRLSGIWLGMCFAWLSSGIFFAVLIFRTDWNEQVVIAQRQSESQNGFQKIGEAEGVETGMDELQVRLTDSDDDSLEA
jgi:MATE family multidrug resistance protein